MFLVWLRTVCIDTTEVSRDAGPVQVRRQQPQHVQLSLAQGLDDSWRAAPVHVLRPLARAAGLNRVATCVGDPTDVRGLGGPGADPVQQHRHRGPLAGEDADVAFRFGQAQCTPETHQGVRGDPVRVLGQRLKDEDFDDGAVAAAGFRSGEQPLQQCG